MKILLYHSDENTRSTLLFYLQGRHTSEVLEAPTPSRAIDILKIDGMLDSLSLIVTEGEADDAWYGQRQIVRNKKTGAGPYLMIGRTTVGRDITVVPLTTNHPAVWCAYTAWDT